MLGGGPWRAARSLDQEGEHPVNDDRVIQVAVVGPGDASDELWAIATEVGRLLAEAGCVVVTGGLGGVMAAAITGARVAGGRTLAVLPGTDPSEAGAPADVVIPTGLGEGRDALVVAAAHGVIAVGGSWGTLAEVALARRTGRPVVAVAGWSVHDEEGRPVPDGPEAAGDAAEAVRRLLAALGCDPDHA
jgi:uncharacterized protein (TIGR00725 family)